MNKLFLVIVFSMTFIFSHSQEKDNLKAYKSDYNKELFKFHIPPSLNGSSFDPTPYSNFNANITETKIALKIGLPGLFKDVEKSDLNKHMVTGFIQPSFKASNGISTLYKDGNPPIEFGVSGGVFFITKNKYWVFTGTNERSSNAVEWVGLNASIEKNNLNIFFPENQYGTIKNVNRSTTGSLFLTYSRYFYSKIPAYKWINVIWNIGAGYAKVNNYYALKKRTYEEGRLVYSNNATTYQSVSESISGALGPLKEYEGLAAFAEAYVPIIRNENTYGSIFLGTRFSLYSLNAKDKLVNNVSGLYFALKENPGRDKSDKKYAATFSVTGQFNQLNSYSKEENFKKNFTVVLQAAVPLRFN